MDKEKRLEQILSELKSLVDGFCKENGQTLGEVEMLRIIARNVSVIHVGGYRAKHFKKTEANKKSM